MELLGIFALLRRANRRRLMVLLYHGVRAKGGNPQIDNLHVPEEKFRAQMQWLRRRFTPVTLDQAMAGLEGRELLPERAALVTFDDAYRNNLDVAAPILSECGIPAVLFVDPKQPNLIKAAQLAPHRVLLQAPLKVRELREALRKLLRPDAPPITGAQDAVPA